MHMKVSQLLVAAAVSGILAGAGQLSFQTVTAAEAGESATEKHDCKGLNSCKGKGGCGTTAHKIECKGKGGCATDKHECKGKNDCKGKGKGGKNECKGKGDCHTPKH